MSLHALALSALFAVQAAWAAAPSPTPALPKLVVVMVVDGLPNEQVQRYREQFGAGGFRRLMSDGAYFNNAHQAHGVTVTAVGHAAILTGAYPYVHGIIGNNWIDPKTQANMYCTEDPAYTYIGAETKPNDGTSPRNLRVNTVGDELRYATGNQSKVVTVSGKDRGAILLAGKSGSAYMFMDRGGSFASSTYYMQQHPAWVQKFNAARPADKYYGKSWTKLLPENAYAHDADDDLIAPRVAGTERNRFPFTMASDSGDLDEKYYNRLRATPFLDALTLDFARAAIDGEQLGKNPAGVPDVLGISLSSHDYVNHAYGPESRASHDHLQQLDRLLAGFFQDLDKKVGLENVLVVLTADHGFPNTPEFYQARHFDSGRVDGKKLSADLDKFLEAKTGLKKLVRNTSLPSLHLDYAQIDKAGLKRAEIEQAAARWLSDQPGIAEAYTRTQLESGNVPHTRIGTLMQRAWNSNNSGDLLIVMKPYWVIGYGKNGTSHGLPYAYDTNVPLFIMGKRWIKPGSVGSYTEVVDLAPTLAYLLHVRPPAGAEGRVLTDVLK
ncbi:alkaline phosphatase family protein [Massilia sp. TS11]|uniref:alkaline phosphatase family protein n=1 Tax=Massilia sp. TS11 TaxID=2908003 RepID=UPI001EDAF06A|nr:alkaline phosphatase family protein [Massilia sp. TS11]MCG2585490.1 alkaline phosphatase family protein [Massilia sp. TS11]